MLETGTSVVFAFALVAGASLAFVVGGVMVFSTLLLSLARPLPLVIVFSISSFIFICIALSDLLEHAEAGYTAVLRDQSTDEKKASGLGQLFAIASLGLGIIMLYTVDAIIYRVSILAANCYGEAGQAERQQYGRRLTIHGSVSTLELAASTYARGLHTSSTLHFDHFHEPELPDISTTASPYEPYAAHSKGLRIRATILSAIAVILHHLPEGLALYVAAIRHLHIGVAVATAVVLHSLPDGTALASSIYFASGHRLRGVFWCLLSPVGKLVGAAIAWFLMGHSEDDRLTHAIATGVSAGILVGVGVKEVMPTTHVYAVGKAHGAVIGIILGMAVIAATRFITE